MAWFDEVRSGVRVAFIILAVVGTLMLLVVGLDLVFLSQAAFLMRGSAMLFVAAMVIFLTIRWWAPWFFAACGVNALRSLMVGIFGRAGAFSAARGQAPRRLFFEMALILALMAFLSFRFTDQRPNWLDSICLVGALVAICFSLISPDHLSWLLMGLLSLGVAFAYEYLRRKLASNAN
jgi:hypothetical protein